MWNQYTDWPALLAAGILTEELGFDSLWTWDHVYPIVGSHEGPIFESWVTLTAWAMATEREDRFPGAEGLLGAVESALRACGGT